MIFKNNTLLTFLAFLLSLLGLIGPGFWDIKSPNPVKYENDNLTRATLGLRFNPNDIDLDNKFKNSKISSKNYFGKEIAIAWSKNFIDQIKIEPRISRIYFTQLPSDLNTYEINDKKKIFISIMLPLLLKGNEKVSIERLNLIIFFKKRNFKKLKIFCKKYKINTINCNNLDNLNNDELKTLQNSLLNRVNVFPISMMLAQAIVESGWGGSRFAQKGNALFGQWTWDKKKGISPKGIHKPSFAVKSFKNLQESVDAYILNLNTHPAYSKLRNYRELIRNPQNYKGQKFSRYLDKYAIIGFEYVKKINLMIKENNLEKFNSLSFKLEN